MQTLSIDVQGCEPTKCNLKDGIFEVWCYACYQQARLNEILIFTVARRKGERKTSLEIKEKISVVAQIGLK